MPPTQSPAARCRDARSALMMSRSRRGSTVLSDGSPGAGAGRWRGCTSLLLRIARGELRRRSGQHPITGPELDDLAHQAAADALLAITGKLERIPRGEPVHDLGLQVRHPRGLDQARPTLLAETRRSRSTRRTGTGCPTGSGWTRPTRPSGRDLVDALRRAVDEDLTERQRQVFVAIVLQRRPARRPGGAAGI